MYIFILAFQYRKFMPEKSEGMFVDWPSTNEVLMGLAIKDVIRSLNQGSNTSCCPGGYPRGG